jgi:flavin-binding protein dodecin
MPDHVFQLTEVTGTSSTTIEDAVASAVKSAAKTIGDLRWFSVSEIRGAIKDDKVAQWQVTVKVGSRMAGG